MPGSLTDSLSMGEVPGSIPGSALCFCSAGVHPVYLFDVVTGVLLGRT
jgi:hypothetical protein